MHQNFEWKVKRSNKTTLHLVCIIDDCTWKLRAMGRDERTYFQVRSFVNEHSCPLEEIHRRHRQASAVIIEEVVAPRLQQHDGRPMRPKDVIANMKTMYGIQIMYRKIRGTMFVATAQDGNEHMFPIAFGYGDSKNNLSWEWFLECLRGALGNIDDLVFISDRHASIEAGISKVFPYATHTICCWHFGENMKKRFHKKDVADIMNDAARSYSELKYNRHMEELRKLHKAAFDYAIAADLQKWSAYTVPKEEFIRNMLQKWFHDRHAATRSMSHRLTDAAHLVILKRVEKERNLDFISLCANYYKRETLIDAYSVPIIPVGHPSSWVVSSDIAARVVLNPKTKRQSGGVPTRLWLIKVPVELFPRNTVASATSVIQLDTTNKRALIRKTIKHNKAVQDEDELPPEAP
ncbi:hypothetical protein QYF36_021423 [Acer negundo]|nr:hypothetical protein QYF36_021423 [Acer negundo]